MTAATHADWLFVPINWHWVAEEVAYVLDNADVSVLLVDDRFSQVAAEAVQRDDCPTLSLCAVMGADTGKTLPEDFKNYEDILTNASPTEPDEQGMGGPMFYTSGTTGRPKGVRSSTFSPGKGFEILQMMSAGLSGMLQMPADGRTLLNGPVYHSAQWAFSFLPLLNGSAVVMRHRFDAAETLEVIDRYQVTNVHLVPTQFVRMLRLDEDIRKQFKGDSLSIVWHGAAPCSPQVKKQMIEWWGPKVWEYYGSTEGSIISVISSEEWLERGGSLGKVVPMVEARVVKEDGSQAAANESGQLYFKNMMGSDFEYHKDDKKTADAHLEPGVFTFGDIGYLDDDGYLWLSDRKIDMIISGGVNIYPAEIEGALAAHPAVADVAFFGIPNEEFGEEVKAAVELSEGHSPSDELAENLVAYCREHLAGYKAPKSIDFEDSLPRHPTGKLYKRLLRDRYWQNQERQI
ncbi:MAG: AMP-binding protein, partial [Pseudomonadota bacterium]